MSNKVVKTKLVEGSRNATFHIYLESDGIEGELSNAVLLDSTADFNPPMKDSDKLIITQIWYSLAWFDVLLSVDALEPFPLWVLARDTKGYADFRYFGGLPDDAQIQHTGKILISTNDFAPAGSTGTLVVEIQKKY